MRLHARVLQHLGRVVDDGGGGKGLVEEGQPEGNLSERSVRLEALTGAIADLENSIRRASDLTRPF